MHEFEEQITVSAEPETVWEVLSDIGNIHLWNPGVIHSEKTTAGEVGLGAGRRCHLKGKNYLDETVVHFERPRQMTIRIRETNLPFEKADIRFFLRPLGEGKETKVTVSPKYQLKFGRLGRWLNWAWVGSQYRKGMQSLLRGLKDFVEKPHEN